MIGASEKWNKSTPLSVVNRPFDPRWHDKDVANIYVMPLTVEYDRAQLRQRLERPKIQHRGKGNVCAPARRR
jgi:hypothetical protein